VAAGEAVDEGECEAAAFAGADGGDEDADAAGDGAEVAAGGEAAEAGDIGGRASASAVAVESSGKILQKARLRRLNSRDCCASRRFCSTVDETLPVVGVSSSMNDSNPAASSRSLQRRQQQMCRDIHEPVRMLPTLHIGFQVSG
jgi:hypothetical protein